MEYRAAPLRLPGVCLFAPDLSTSILSFYTKSSRNLLFSIRGFRQNNFGQTSNIMNLRKILFTRDRLASMILSIVVFSAFAINTTGISASVGTRMPVQSFGPRTLSIVSTQAAAGSQVSVSIEIDSQGDEVAFSFSLNFDPTVLSNPVASLGSGVPASTSVGLNSTQTQQGRLGVLVDTVNAFQASPPNRQVVVITFTVLPGAFIGSSSITFGSSPTGLSTASTVGALLPTSYQPGNVTVLPPSAVPVTLGGRVTTPNGQNLRNAVVSLIDSNNVRRTATTSSFGLYSFANVASGQTYTMTVGSKRYRFEARIVTPTESVSNLDFVGLE